MEHMAVNDRTDDVLRLRAFLAGSMQQRRNFAAGPGERERNSFRQVMACESMISDIEQTNLGREREGKRAAHQMPRPGSSFMPPS